MVLVSLLESDNLAAEVSCGDELRLYAESETVVGRVESVAEQSSTVIVTLSAIDPPDSEGPLAYWLVWGRRSLFGGRPWARLYGVSIPPDASLDISSEDATQEYGEVDQLERR